MLSVLIQTIASRLGEAVMALFLQYRISVSPHVMAKESLRLFGTWR